MEENKNIPKNPANANANANANGAHGGGNGNHHGGRHRRKKKHKGGNGNPNNPNGGNNANQQHAQNQNAQSQAQKQKEQQKQHQKQQNAGQNNGNNGQKQGNNNAQKQNNGNNNPNNSNKPKQPNPNANNNAQNKNKQQSQNNNQNNNQNNAQNKDENRKDTYAYVLDGTLYINLTNKCSNGCDFCVRNERTSYYGHYLWLKHGEPSTEKVIAFLNGMGDITKYKEAVFCGFGEPTYKMEEMLALCDYFHSKGLKTRLNTNGQGNLINKRDIVPEMKGKIDLVNVSLNASCAEKYQKICRSMFRDMAFDAILEFAKICRRNGVNCRFSIVDCIGEEEVEACKKLCQSVGVPLYIRDYITDS